MREFLAEYDFFLTLGVELLAALIGLLVYRKFKTTKVKYFIWFLWYVFFIDLIGWTPYFIYKYESFKWIAKYTNNTLFERNYLWYGIFWKIGSALFIAFYFRLILTNTYFKRIIKYLTVLFMFISIVYLVLSYETYYKGESYLISFYGVLIIVLSTSFYLTEVLMSSKIINFYKSVHFYIASVFFIFFLIKTPIMFFQIYYSTSDWNFVFLRDDIILFCNLFMYVTFSYALLKCKPEDL
jgi:hypothetical protein